MYVFVKLSLTLLAVLLVLVVLSDTNHLQATQEVLQWILHLVFSYMHYSSRSNVRNLKCRPTPPYCKSSRGGGFNLASKSFGNCQVVGRIVNSLISIDILALRCCKRKKMSASARKWMWGLCYLFACPIHVTMMMWDSRVALQCIGYSWSFEPVWGLFFYFQLLIVNSVCFFLFLLLEQSGGLHGLWS